MEIRLSQTEIYYGLLNLVEANTKTPICSEFKIVKYCKKNLDH